VGLSYNWDPLLPQDSNCISVFDPSVTCVTDYERSRVGGDFTGKSGGFGIAELKFSNGNVIMQGTDQNTGAQAQETFTASGATAFSGNTSARVMHRVLLRLDDRMVSLLIYTGSEQGNLYFPRRFHYVGLVMMDEFQFPQEVSEWTCISSERNY